LRFAERAPAGMVGPNDAQILVDDRDEAGNLFEQRLELSLQSFRIAGIRHHPGQKRHPIHDYSAKTHQKVGLTPPETAVRVLGDSFLSVTECVVSGARHTGLVTTTQGLVAQQPDGMPEPLAKGAVVIDHSKLLVHDEDAGWHPIQEGCALSIGDEADRGH